MPASSAGHEAALAALVLELLAQRPRHCAVQRSHRWLQCLERLKTPVRGG